MNTQVKSKNWYREPWAWMVVGPLFFVIVMCMGLLYLAIKYGDDVVSDDYYKEGKLLNNRFQAERYAQQNSIVGELVLVKNEQQFVLNLNQPLDSDEQLQLLLSHPARADKDISVSLKRFSLTAYQAELESLPSGRWYVRVESRKPQAEHPLWRLSGEVDFSGNTSFTLQ